MYFNRSMLLVCSVMWSVVCSGHAQVKRIAIMELENKSDQMLSQGEVSSLTSSIRIIFSHLPKDEFSIITKENIEVMLPPDQTLEDCVGTCAVETGRLLNAQWVISGDVIKFGSKLKSTIKLHETRSGAYITGVQIKGESVDDLEKPILLGSLKLLYHVDPVYKSRLVQRTGSEHIERHLMCLLDEAHCHPKKRGLSAPKRLSTGQASQRSKVKARVTEKPSALTSIGKWISKASRIKLDRYNKQRVAFFDLNRGAFIRSGEGRNTSHLLRDTIRQLNPKYFSVMSKEKMIRRLPPHSDMMCRQHSYCMSLGRELGVHWIFAGDVIRFGGSLSVFLRLYDVKTGLIRASEILTGETVSELKTLITSSLLRKMLNMEE